MSLATTAVRLKVVLKDVEPKVVRKIVVPFTIRLDRLHLVLQAAMGWENYHLYAFSAGPMQWGVPDPDWGDGPMDAKKTRLCDVINETGAKTIHYLYDFGDSWDHVITLERFFQDTDMIGLPMLLEAKGCCPPEDAGGAPGYAAYVEAITDKTHPDHAGLRDWRPGFDPQKLDQTKLERDVDALAKKWQPKPRKKK